MEITDISGTWEVKITCKESICFLPGSKWLPKKDGPYGSGWVLARFKFTAIVTINQSKIGISGTFITVHGLIGKITGNVHGHEVSLAFDPSPIRPEPYPGVAMVIASDKQMRGTYSSTGGGGTFQGDFIGVKKYSPTIRLKLWWWRNIFPLIAKTSTGKVIVSIVVWLALPSWVFSWLAVMFFYRQGRTILLDISAVFFFLSLIGFCWVIFLGMGLLGDVEDYKEKLLGDLYYYNQIFSWYTLFLTLIHIIALCLFLYSISIWFTWWS